MRRLVTFVLVIVGTLLMTGREPVQTARPAGPSLTAMFTPATGLVRDTNGDGLADAVAARVIVPAQPSPGDVEAAVNIAARLGYETTAMTLPLVVRDGDVTAPKDIAVPIIVGRGNALLETLATVGGLSLANLQPGQGLVAAVASPLGGPDGLVVVGADDAGTVAAGVQLAARLPRLWSMTGAQLASVDDQITGVLRARNVVGGVSVTGLVVDRERRGIAAVRARVDVTAAEAPRVQQAFEALDAAHRRGAEMRALNFANVATTAIEIVTGTTRVAEVSVRRAGLNPRTLTPPIDPDELAPDSPGERGRAAETPATSGKTFDLRSLYGLEGWYGDNYTDLIPDRTDATIVLGGNGDSLGAAHIAARLGLETTGITLPITRVGEKVKEPAREANPVLVGRDNALTAQLVKIGRVQASGLTPGDGLVQIVTRAFGPQSALVVSGADAAGVEAASRYVGGRLPYVWDSRRGSLQVGDVADELSRFFQARTRAGQAGLILGELDSMLGELRERSLESVDVTLFIEQATPALDAVIEKRVGEKLGAIKASAKSQGITDPATVFEDVIKIPWEVDEVREKVTTELLPKVKGQGVDLEVRVSESLPVRQRLAAELRDQLAGGGAVNPKVTVLSAYKQGFLWLTEQVFPALRGRNVRSLHVSVARLDVDLSKAQKFYEVPSRWVHELYPVDEIAQRELGLPPSAFEVELVDSQKDIYHVTAKDAAGCVVQQVSFSPKMVEREYLDKFPGWGRVHVTTGWVTATVGGQKVLDARVATDPERFWDHYQGKVLPRVYDHVMKVTDNRPMPDKQPFHRDFDMEVTMSEPDFRLGVDEELVSSIEALHEDLYFVTLDFFDALGRTTVRRRLAAPGKIFPIMHPERPGRPGEARILYAGNASTKPRIEIAYREKGVEKPGRLTRDITKVDATAPTVTRAVVRNDRVRELELMVEAKDDKEAGRAVDALDALVSLQKAGVFKTDLSYAQVDRVAVTVGVNEARTVRYIASTGDAAPSRVRRATAAPPSPLIKWDHIIGPEESEELVGKLAWFPEVRAYRAGRSYRGRDISVMELTAPAGGELVSTTKLTAWKPTIFITGRQHANEVSSTSHILRLAELLLTDPAYQPLLKKMNVILHPVENPDGAAMAYELQKLTPTHMLHAGRYSALGMDVASQVGLADPLLPEALVRGNVWQEWLPDIYLNPHGYPSHEWVQQFAGYVPPGFRSYWTTRGWYTSVGALRDPRYPDHPQVAAAIRDNIVREINSNPDVKAMNLRHQARYRKWAWGFSPYVFPQEIVRDTAIYYTDPESGEVQGSRRAGVSRFGGGGGGGRASMASWPQVTYFNGGTETPDETAQGAWLDLVTKPGFSYLMASIRYLETGTWTVERIEEDGQRDATTRTMLRVRPVKRRF